MKKLFITSICMLFFTLSVFGQGNRTNRADRSYVKAAQSYKALLHKDSTVHILQRLGDCYYLNAEMDEAAKWYESLFSKFQVDSIAPEYLFKYAQALRGQGKYDESDEWIQKFSEKQKNDARGKNFTDSELTVSDLKPAIGAFQLTNLTSVNTEQSDFGATFYKDGIMFASTRPQSR